MLEIEKVVEQIDFDSRMKFPVLTKKIINHILVEVVKNVSKDLQKSIQKLFPGELAEHAKNEGEKAIKWNIRGENKLVFSLNTVKKLFKKSILEEDIIYLTAVLEYLTAELVELSINAAMVHNKFNVEAKYLFEAIENDTELKKLIFKKLGLSKYKLSCI